MFKALKLNVNNSWYFFINIRKGKIYALFFYFNAAIGMEDFFLFSSWMLLQRMKSFYYFILFIMFFSLLCVPVYSFLHFSCFKMKIVFVLNLYRILLFFLFCFLLVDFILFLLVHEEKNYAYQAKVLLFSSYQHFIKIWILNFFLSSSINECWVYSRKNGNLIKLDQLTKVNWIFTDLFGLKF